MKRQIPLGELILVIGTRALLGGGLGLLLSDRLTDEERKTMGWTLVLVGALTTIPIFIDLFTPSPSISIGSKLNGDANGANPIQALVDSQAR